jgi:hypothetical protein
MSRTPSSLWGIVLAGGEGVRLKEFVRERVDTDTPKQFCAFEGTRTLLERTVRRAEVLIPSRHLVVSATAHHRSYLFHSLGNRPPGTLFAATDGSRYRSGYSLSAPPYFTSRPPPHSSRSSLRTIVSCRVDASCTPSVRQQTISDARTPIPRSSWLQRPPLQKRSMPGSPQALPSHQRGQDRSSG